ncbi:MAG: hypothetical protein A3A65_04515 [Candidatus Chisholmbacteria bacterium RIFCSPLOWO2_01_FULL_49_14]|uniref:Glycosyltransferase RgtA/B/C/D-like domain-containing protein n=1 Tax=Candidatus Chisholmbacteria bacterium RIFCSPLOWO2_01_FULL_49_14 TaxID=1797593 RepID=A0A1G1W470_9BACT|nr:MAG: hypothetical protein A3A65_04515 [Candidatus Chisholmbacteria bacterium RIFCSPLOWO2_01_FULL_49_14]
MKKYFKAFSIWLVAALALALLCIWPLFRGGYWESDDGEWMVIRFSAFHESLRDGQFPVRWTQRLNHEFGYPVANFLYPLPFYLAEIPHALGFGFVDSIKIVLGGSVILAAQGMFLYAKKWGHLPALMAAAFYVFTPYRIFLLYGRGSLGESTALAVVPFLFLSADSLVRKANYKNITALGLFYAALIMSHNVMALIFTPVLLLYIARLVFKSKKRHQAFRSLPAVVSDLRNGRSGRLRKFAKRMAGPLYAFILGLSLSAFFWIPALWDLQYTRAGGVDISDYRSYFLPLGEIVRMLGIIPLLFVGIAGIKRQWLFMGMALLVIFLMHPLSSPLLNLFPALKLIQFPWRLSTLFVFIQAVSAAVVFSALNTFPRFIKGAAILLAFIVLSQYVPRATQVRFIDRGEGFYATNDDTTTVKNEFTPIWIKTDPKNRPETPYSLSISEDRYEILEDDKKTGNIYLEVRLQEPALMTLNIHYFPGWKVFIDDEEVNLNPQETDGLLRFQISPGQDKTRVVKAIFGGTLVRNTAEGLSAIALIIVLTVAAFKYVPNNPAKSVGIILMLIALFSAGHFMLANLSTYWEIFNPKQMEKDYLNSQWVNPDAGTSIPIGDSGLYSWAGWRYVHGENPILINPEMPPLGKYLIGLGLLLFRRPALVGLAFFIFALLTHFALGMVILKDRWLAIAATALLVTEPVFRNLANITMLDGLQMAFINLTFLFFIRGLKEGKWFIPASLMVGAVAATKFFAAAATIVVALFGFLLLKRKWKTLRQFTLSLPLAGLVHLASYTALFMNGFSFREYLGTQKWILTFYRQGNVGTVPTGSYWLLVLFNRWRVWFGQEWGVYTTVKSNLWRVSWPLNVLAVLVAAIRVIMNKLAGIESVLVVWLAVYAIFLTFIIGWPHYMLLFLPYSTILLVQLGKIYGARASTFVHRGKQQLFAGKKSKKIS